MLKRSLKKLASRLSPSNWFKNKPKEPTPQNSKAKPFNIKRSAYHGTMSRLSPNLKEKTKAYCDRTKMTTPEGKVIYGAPFDCEGCVNSMPKSIKRLKFNQTSQAIKLLEKECKKVKNNEYCTKCLVGLLRTIDNIRIAKTSSSQNFLNQSIGFYTNPKRS